MDFNECVLGTREGSAKSHPSVIKTDLHEIACKTDETDTKDLGRVRQIQTPLYSLL